MQFGTGTMTDAEAIAAVKAGGRALTNTGLHVTEQPGICAHLRGWRAIACDGETDVVECPTCGRQRLAKCNFDEECA